MGTYAAREGLFTVKAIRKSQPLSRESNAVLARQIALGGPEAQDATNAMITGNLRLVLMVASKYVDKYLTLDDRIQEGVLGLMRAIRKFDPDRGVGFATYAVFWIRASIERAINRNENIIHVPADVVTAMRRLRRVEATTPHPLTQEESREVLHLGVLSTEAALLLPNVLSADSPITESGEGLLLEMLQGGASDTPEFRLSEVELWEVLHQCPNILERDRTIMGMYVFGTRYSEIAAELGLSRERVRQIVTATTIRLRAFAAK
jgi:RNA polymerase primary sigma factor